LNLRDTPKREKNLSSSKKACLASRNLRRELQKEEQASSSSLFPPRKGVSTSNGKNNSEKTTAEFSISFLCS